MKVYLLLDIENHAIVAWFGGSLSDVIRAKNTFWCKID